MQRFILTAAFVAIAFCAAIATAADSAKHSTGCAASCSLDAATPAPAMSGMSGMGGASGSMDGMGNNAGDADMGPHMHLTQLAAPAPGDRARAQAIVDALIPAIQKYQDYRLAEADGYVPFHLEIPMPMYHFTNYRNAWRARFGFDPTQPTSLLYKRDGSGFRLIGAMYTAPRSYTLAQLNDRVPLSVARWHEHVDLCWGPRGTPMSDYLGADARFGFKGSIATADACGAAGGTFMPIVFNWMVHVYPYEKDQADVWKAEI